MDTDGEAVIQDVYVPNTESDVPDNMIDSAQSPSDHLNNDHAPILETLSPIEQAMRDNPHIDFDTSTFPPTVQNTNTTEHAENSNRVANQAS